MRKLVLSGFLASEEIYINQLEALLLVSTCTVPASAPVQWHHTSICLRRNCPSLPWGHLCNDSSYCKTLGSQGHYQEKLVPPSPDPLVPCSWNGRRRHTAKLGGADSPIICNHWHSHR